MKPPRRREQNQPPLSQPQLELSNHPASVGIDPSLTGTGLVVMNQFGGVIHKSVVVSKPTAKDVNSRIARIDELVCSVMAVIAAYSPSIVLVEGYSFMSKTPATDRIEYGGLLRWSIIRAGYRLYEVAPTTLKKWATGSGAGDKTGVVAELTKRYGVTFKTSDEYDAYALSRMGIQIGGWEQPATKQQAEAIKTVTTPKPEKGKKNANS